MVNSWSVSSALDFLNFFPTLTTVCGSSSLLIHVIFSPDFTVKVWGLNAKSLISILFCLLPVLSMSFISPASAKIDTLRKLIAHNSAILLFLGVSVVIGLVRLAEVGIDDGEGCFALLILNARQAKHAPQFFSRHSHRTGRRRGSRSWLREGSRHSRVESHVTFDFLQHLMDMTV